MSTKLETIQRRAIAALRRYVQSKSTEDLREVANLFIDCRESFFTAEGNPDWLGRTHVYRRWVRETMTLANVPPESLPSIQAAIRYHTSYLLRERLDAETLEELGLQPSSSRDRSTAKWTRYSETLALFSGGAAIESADDVLRLTQLVEHALRRISTADMASAERAAVASSLLDMCKHAEKVAEDAADGAEIA